MFGLLGARDAETVTTRLAIRTARRLDQVDTDELVDRIGALREEIARVRHQLGRETVPETTLGALASALDHTSRLITGGEGSRVGTGRFGSAVLARRCSYGFGESSASRASS
jgi:uncharacterized small protein (DUF1192 family)